jgi:hypothetical protein
MSVTVTEAQAREILLTLADELVSSSIGHNADVMAYQIWIVAKRGRREQVAEMVQILGKGVVEDAVIPFAVPQRVGKGLPISEGQAKLLLVRLRKNGYGTFEDQCRWLEDHNMALGSGLRPEEMVEEMTANVNRDDFGILLGELPEK